MTICRFWVHFKETKDCWFQRVNATTDSRESRTESWLSPCSEIDDEWQ